jgi:hypothetical protein
MNINVAIQIVSFAISLFQNVLIGAAQSHAAIAKDLTNIVRVAKQAYEDHVGQPIDPSLIKPETGI